MNVDERERSDFGKRFKALTGHAPFGWQRRLFEKHFMPGNLPSALDLPTGLGKTSVMTIWYLARRAGARVPRRLVYVVDRRAVVDQATVVAESIQQGSCDSALRISTLRGQYADNRDWLEDPAASVIIVGTVDMIGSRLLFEGYGVSRGMRPYHAGLLGADTLVVLDESHLVPPFERLLERIARDRDEDNALGPKEAKNRDLIPRFCLLPLSATGRDRGGDVFRLTEKDREDPVVKARLDAKKRLVFKPVGDKKLEERLAEEAWALSGEGRAHVRILIYCNSRDVAEKTKKAIEKKLKEYNKNPENVQLFVGARRVKERGDAKKKLEGLGFFSGNDAPDKAAFVIATSAGEVGVDLDADHMVMDLVPFERMVQRLGRVNRLGGEDREAHIVVIGEPDKDLPDNLKERAEKAALLLWGFLLPLSATGDRSGDVFHLTERDREDLVVKQILGAKKRLVFEPVGDKKLEEKLAEEAWALSGEGKSAVRVLIYCNSHDVAEKTKKAIENKLKEYNKNKMEPAQIPPENVRRVKDREDAKNKLEGLGFFSGNDAPDKPAFVIATSADEVGVDLDADHMVMDLVPFEHMVQRLGRVNRLGGEGRETHIVVIEEPGKALLDDLKRAKKAVLPMWGFLPPEDTAFQAGPGALIQLKEALKNREWEQCIRDASSPDPLYPALTRPLLDAWSMTSLKEHTGRPEVQPWLHGWIDGDPPRTTLVWRKFLPVRVQGGAASEREVDDFFAAAPPHLTELLEAPTYKVHEWLFKRAEKLAEAIGKTGDNASADGAGNTDADDPAPLNEQKIVAIGLGRSDEDAELFTLDGLVEEAAKLAKAPQHRRKQIKEMFERKIKGNTLILDARMGGLSSDGLFDPQKEEDASTPDTDDDWETVIGFRMRSITPDAENPDADWHKPYLFDLRRDDEGQPLRQLRVEKYKAATATEEERSLSPKQAQKLEEHQEWAARKAEKLVELLKLPDNIGKAIVLAARLHDEGKRAANWQRAFNADADGSIYAKTTGPFLRSVLAGYRHEFGSLPHIEQDDAFKALPNDLKDLVLHLVAAHHGRARPVIETAGCADKPPSQLTARARDVALRFARLQKRFGPWGLAWLEALLRAADQQASRDLDQGETPDG